MSEPVTQASHHPGFERVQTAFKTKEDEWYSDPSNLQYLSVLLADPILKFAIEVVKEIRKPVWGSNVASGQDGIVDGFRANARLEGFYDFQEQLSSLTMPRPKEMQPIPEQYGDEMAIEYAAKHYGIDLNQSKPKP